MFHFGQRKKKATTPPPTLSAPSSCAEQHIPPAEPWSCGSQERRNPQQKGLSEAENENLELRQSGEGTGKQKPRRSLAAEDTKLCFVQAAPRALPPDKSSLWDLQPYNRTGKGLRCQDPLSQGDRGGWLAVRGGEGSYPGTNPGCSQPSRAGRVWASTDRWDVNGNGRRTGSLPQGPHSPSPAALTRSPSWVQGAPAVCQSPQGSETPGNSHPLPRRSPFPGHQLRSPLGRRKLHPWDGCSLSCQIQGGCSWGSADGDAQGKLCS